MSVALGVSALHAQAVTELPASTHASGTIQPLTHGPVAHYDATLRDDMLLPANFYAVYAFTADTRGALRLSIRFKPNHSDIYLIDTAGTATPMPFWTAHSDGSDYTVEYIEPGTWRVAIPIRTTHYNETPDKRVTIGLGLDGSVHSTALAETSNEVRSLFVFGQEPPAAEAVAAQARRVTDRASQFGRLSGLRVGPVFAEDAAYSMMLDVESAISGAVQAGYPAEHVAGLTEAMLRLADAAAGPATEATMLARRSHLEILRASRGDDTAFAWALEELQAMITAHGPTEPARQFAAHAAERADDAGLFDAKLRIGDALLRAAAAHQDGSGEPRSNRSSEWTARNIRADALLKQGHYAEGLEAYRWLYDHIDRVSISQTERYQVLVSYATALGVAGKIDEAVRITTEAQAMVPELEEHLIPMVATAANAQHMHRLGRFDEALRILEPYRSQAMADAGDELRGTAFYLQWLGNTLLDLGRAEEARAAYSRALEYSRALDNNFEQTVMLQRCVADATTDLEEAIAIYNDVIANYQRHLPGHPDYAVALRTFGNAFEQAGRLNEAAAKYRNAYRILRDTIGPEHPDAGSTATALARVYARLGKHEQARDAAIEALDAFEARLRTELVVMDRVEAFRRFAQYERPDQIILRLALAGHASERDALRALFVRQGVVLEAVAARHAAAMAVRDAKESEHADTVERIHTRLESARASLGAALINQAGDPQRIPALRLEIAELDRSLTALIPELAREARLARFTPEDILATLPEHHAAVLYFTVSAAPDAPPTLAALTASSGRTLSLVELAPVSDVDELVAGFRAEMMGVLAQLKGELDRSEQRPYPDRERDTAAYLHRLHRVIWAELPREVRDADLVHIVPVGSLGSLPFEALVTSLEDPQRPEYLAERGPLITYTTGLRQIGRLQATADLRHTSPGATVGLPDFRAMPKEGDSLADADAWRSGQPAVYETHQLEFTKDWIHEGKGGRNDWGDLSAYADGLVRMHQGLRSVASIEPLPVLTGPAAQEDVVRLAIARPEAIQVLTHGFFDHERSAPGTGMLYSYLLFSGANWSNRLGMPGTPAIDASNDGQLTGSDILQMDFRGTRYVLLTACHSGEGTDAGEAVGVEGIRSAFMVAGARAAIGTLWEVSARAAVYMFDAFYGSLAEQPDAPDALAKALRDAQLKTLGFVESVPSVRCRHPFFWAFATITGSPGDAAETP